MKYAKLTLIITLMFFSPLCFGVMAYGTVLRTEIDTTTTTRSNLAFFIDKQTYATNGITFTYPSNLFIQDPHVLISVQPVASHPTTETYVAEISACSNTSCTIMVYQVVAGTVNEAPTASMLVHVFVVEDPV